jgi:crotonobetainyl-CoA:carnitine CoA-transferase CaiB-like acyl-CoA transferase
MTSVSGGAVGLPLKDIVVADLSRVLAGPLSTMLLGDLGASVIKVEHPERGDDTRDWGIPVARGETSYYFSFNRNKQSICLDLSTTQGVEAVRKLCVQADIVVENFKTGGMEKFGLGYRDLQALNPRLIYCSISGYGRIGSEATRPGYDLVVQGETGLMGINGEGGRPPLKFGVAVVDLFTGMSAAQAMLAALYQREKTGQGRRIDLALYDCGIMVSSYYGREALMLGEDPPRYGNAHPSIVPYGVFDAQDGPLVITVGTNRQFHSLCSAVLKRDEIARDPRFSTNVLRARHRKELLALLEPELRRHSRAHLLKGLAAENVPCGEVLGPHEALANARTHESGMVAERAHASGVTLPLFNPPWRFDGERLPVVRPPMLGEHDAEIRSRFGL